MMPAFASARPRWEISSAESPSGSSGGPGSVSIGIPAERSLVVSRDVLHALAEGRQLLAFLQIAANEVLSRLRERGLDQEVVERHRGRQLAAGAVGAQLIGHRVETVEDPAEAHCQLRLDRLKA